MAKLTSVNQVPATGAAAVYSMKTVLVSAGWTVMSSSDGTTYNSSGDQITDATKLAATNAWVRLRDPGSRREFVLQRTTNNTLWRLKVSESAGFVGGSPGATRVPSATDEGVFLGSGTDASPTGAQWLPTDNTYKCHTIAFSDPVATNVYSFFFFTTTPGTGIAQSRLFVDGTVEYSDQETSPLFILCSYSATNIPIGTYMPGGNYGGAWMYIYYGHALQAFVNAQLYGICLTSSGSAGTALPPSASTSALPVDPYTGNYVVWKALYIARSKAISTTTFEWKGYCARLTWAPLYNLTYPNTINLASDAYMWTDTVFIVPWENGTLGLL